MNINETMTNDELTKLINAIDIKGHENTAKVLIVDEMASLPTGDTEKAMTLIDSAVIEAGQGISRESVVRIAIGVFKAMKVDVSDEEIEVSVDRAMRFVANNIVRKAA